MQHSPWQGNRYSTHRKFLYTKFNRLPLIMIRKYLWLNLNIFLKWRFICCMQFKREERIKYFISDKVWALEVQGVPLPTKPGSSLIILLQTHSNTYRHNFTTDTFLFISHTTNVLLFKSRCNIFIGFGIIKELPGLVGSGTPCTTLAHSFVSCKW
jgi:hypothetical protein